jgi:hypothetical protein
LTWDFAFVFEEEIFNSFEVVGLVAGKMKVIDRSLRLRPSAERKAACAAAIRREAEEGAEKVLPLRG